MKSRTKLAVIMTVLFVILAIFFEAKTEYLLIHVKDLERYVESVEKEKEKLQKDIDYLYEYLELEPKNDNENESFGIIIPSDKLQLADLGE